jgi:hypothetical protein
VMVLGLILILPNTSLISSNALSEVLNNQSLFKIV